MKPKYYLFIKAAFVLFFAVYLFLVCRTDSAKNIPMEEITSELEADTTITLLTKQERTGLMQYYQIRDTDTQGFLFYKAQSPMSVDELMIVRAKSQSQAETFQDAALSRLESQKKVFESYGTDQMALLGDALVGRRGNYVYYMCGPDAASWQQAFLALIS